MARFEIQTSPQIHVADTVARCIAAGPFRTLERAQLELATWNRYQDIGGGYSYARLRVGLVLRAPDGREVYCQPGDDENAMQATIDALDEVEGDAARGRVADIAFGDYFS